MQQLNDDFYFIEMMKAITEPLMQEVMTDEQAEVVNKNWPPR